MRTILAGMAALLAASTAQAADLATRAPAAMGVQSYSTTQYNWTGLYAGGNLGGAWGHHSTSVVTGGGTTLFSSGTDPSGFIGGGQIGYNWQMGNWVFGIEADIQGSDVHGSDNPTFTVGPFAGTASLNERLDWFGTVRGRLGYAWDRHLVYFTGGWAYGHETVDATAAVAGIAGTRSASVDLKDGWALGGGWEWAFAPQWSVRAEYLHLDFGSDSALSYTITPGGAVANVSSNHLTADVGRVGLNYKFW